MSEGYGARYSSNYKRARDYSRHIIPRPNIENSIRNNFGVAVKYVVFHNGQPIIQGSASKKASTRVPELQRGDEILFYYNGNSFGPSVTYTGDGREVVIGNAQHHTGLGHRTMTIPYGELDGFWIVNEFSSPLRLHYLSPSGHKSLVAVVQGNDGRGYHSGGGSKLFIDNGFDGWSYGDRFQVDILLGDMAIPGPVFYLSDQQIKEIVIGNGYKGGVEGFKLRRDNFIYRIGEPTVHSGDRFMV